jgi:transposase
MQIIAETGADMTPFDTSNKLSKWAGLCPRNDESAGKIKSKATTKGNKYLRRILVQVAWAAARTKGSHCQYKFQQLAVRKGNKKALIALARKQLTVIWNMLSKKQAYNPNLQPVMSIENIVAKKKYLLKELSKLDVLSQTIVPLK